MSRDSRYPLTAFMLGSALMIALLLPCFAHATPSDAGARIYLEGELASGQALTGTRFGDEKVSGAAAACVNCHRPSGMGQVEGEIQVPPITGNFLYASGRDKAIATMDPHVSKRFNQAHDPYTEKTLYDAIVRGVNNQGRQMNAAMPRFNLDEEEVRALTAYLKQLSAQWSPGASGENIHFAMPIAPGVAPARRDALIEMMRTIVRQKNSSTVVAGKPGAARHHMASAAELVLGTERNWTLEIWQLQGTPDTWGAQLDERYRNEPPFALISGISDSTWQPVHDFCERRQVPCWFPSVVLPPQSESRYSLYFSAGLAIEADVLAQHLKTVDTRGRLIQILEDDAVSRAASGEVSSLLKGSKIRVENRVLHPEGGLKQALRKIGVGDTVMLWLRPERMTELAQLMPASKNNYFSALLSGAEHAPLPENWKAGSHLLYPYELPEQRKLNLAYFHAWLNINRLPLIDEAMQSEAFFAMNFLSDTLAQMLDNLYRDYLLERAEVMLSKREGGKAEQETRDRVALGLPGDMERKHGAPTLGMQIGINNERKASHGTTMYPHLSLGPGQRIASKGAYIVRFAADGTLAAETGWIVP